MIGMGYFAEEKEASRQMLTAVTSWVHGQAPPSSIDWPRHGLIGSLFHLPFVAVDVKMGTERVAALEPILTTSLLLGLLFLWASELSRSVIRGYFLTLIAGFCTFLWPYAYIGLETLQSLALFLAAFLALR